jgi:MFS family permease
MTYIVEAAPDRKRGMLAGFLPMGTLSGNAVAVALVTGLQIALPQHDMASWGWRTPFVLALPLGRLDTGLYVASIRFGLPHEVRRYPDHWSNAAVPQQY